MNNLRKGQRPLVGLARTYTRNLYGVQATEHQLDDHFMDLDDRGRNPPLIPTLFNELLILRRGMIADLV